MNGHSLTIHNMDSEFYKRLVAEANRRDLSLNKTFLEWARRGAGITNKKKKRNLSRFFGVWSKEEAEEFDRAAAESEKIYPGDWP